MTEEDKIEIQRIILSNMEEDEKIEMLERNERMREALQAIADGDADETGQDGPWARLAKRALNEQEVSKP